MYPAVATGAHNPANGMVAAVFSTELHDQALQTALPPPQLSRHYGADALAEQILTAIDRCRALGHREPRISLTRPTEVVEGVCSLLELAGLRPSIRPSSVLGQSVLTVRV